MKKFLLLPCFCLLAFWSSANNTSILDSDGNDSENPTFFEFSESATSAVAASVTFCVDVTNELPLTTVEIFGTFTGNFSFSLPLIDQGANIWCIDIANLCGNQEFKFKVDGVEEQFNEGDLCTATCCGGQFTNRVINFPGTPVPITENFVFNAPCDATPPPPDLLDVTLCVNLNCETGPFNGLSVSGSFNCDNINIDFLTETPAGSGIYCKTVGMVEGAQDFQFHYQPNQFGGGIEVLSDADDCVTNGKRPITVTTEPIQIYTFDWGECTNVCVPPPMVDVEFCVDLSCIPGQVIDPHVVGSFTPPGPSPGTSLTEKPADSDIYCRTFSVPVGDHTYSFFYQQKGFEAVPDACNVNGQRTITILDQPDGQDVLLGWESCDAVCTPPPPVTLCVDVSCLPDVERVQIFGTFTDPIFCADCTPDLTTQDGAIYCIDLTLPLGLTEYKFLVNGCAESLLLDDCTFAPFGFINRVVDVNGLPGQSFTYGWESCTEECNTNVDLKLTFEDPGLDYALVTFAGAVSSIQPDPTDPGNTVVCTWNAEDAACFAGTIAGGYGLAHPIPFTATDKTMTVRVWSPQAGIPVLLKVENAGNNAIAAEVLAYTTVAMEWETLCFDLPVNPANKYDKVILFFNFTCGGSSPQANGPDFLYYWDDVMFCEAPVITSILPECYKYCTEMINPQPSDVTFTDCDGTGYVDITGPQTITPGGNCPNARYRYTYIVIDQCGQMSESMTRDFIIQNDGPEITCPPFNLILDCGDPNNSDYIAAHIGLATATTSCDVGITSIQHFPQSFNNITCGTSRVVTFIATDACGRTASCTSTIAVVDDTPPVFTAIPPAICDVINCSADVDYWYSHWIAYMENGLAADDACGTATVSAIDTPVNTDCPDGTAETVVTFVASDNCGNTATITGTFTVEATPTNIPLLGMISTEQSETVENVAVTLEGNTGFMEMYETAENGMYNFNNLTLGQNYAVTPYLNEDPLNGVSSFDLVLIAKHVLRVESLDSPYKMIAADVNNSGDVSTSDLVALRKLILHVDETFQSNTSWRFVEAAFAFPQDNNPFASIFPEIVNINELTEEEQHDFVAVKVGDVNGSATANQFTTADDRNRVGELVFDIADQQLYAGQTYEVAFRADNFNAIHGYQFSLNFDQTALDFAGVSTGELNNLNESNFGLSLLKEGVITTSWTNQAAQSVARGAEVFQVSFTAKADVKLSEAINVSSRYTKAEAYNGNLDLMDVQFRFENEGVVTNQFRLYQNSPNPFKQETLIGFELPEAGTAALTIYDGSGRLLTQVEGDFAKGYNNISVSNESLTPGLLYYQLVTPSGTATKKMLLSQ